jgi:hypothetical protein
VTAFIILYGLLLFPRIDLGRYWSSMDGVYSGGWVDVGVDVGVDMGVDVGVDVGVDTVLILNWSIPFPCFSSVSLRVFIV